MTDIVPVINNYYTYLEICKRMNDIENYIKMIDPLIRFLEHKKELKEKKLKKNVKLNIPKNYMYITQFEKKYKFKEIYENFKLSLKF